MLTLDKLENLKYNTQPIVLPITPKNRGIMFFLNTPTFDASKEIVMSNIFKNKRNYPGYFLDYIYHLSIFNKTINDKFDTTIPYQNIKVKSTIYKTAKSIVNYKKLNTFVDLYKYNQYFVEYKKQRQGILVIDTYMNMINDYVTKISDGYDRSIMIIDLTHWQSDYKKGETYKLQIAEEPLQIYYNEMLRDIENFKHIPYDILLIEGRQSLLIKPSECDKESATKLKSLLTKFKKASINEESTNEVDIRAKDSLKSEIKSHIIMNNITKYSFNGNNLSDDLSDTIDTTVDKVLNESDIEFEDEDDYEDKVTEVKEKVETELNQNPEFLTKLDLSLKDMYTNNSKASTKRNMLLAEKQAKIKINNQGKTIKELVETASNKKIEPMKLNINTLNPDMKELTFPNFTKQYNNKLFDKDTALVLNAFKDKRIPVYILDIKKEDSSNEFDKKFTYTIKMESSDRIRHTIKVDIPRFIDDAYMYLGGNKKNIINQLVLKPVSKTGPDTVQFCTNYNKIFMRRNGLRISPKLERLKKALILHKGINTKANLFIKTGDNSIVNASYKTTMEYDELANNYMNIYINDSEYIFYFNQDQIREEIKNRNLKYKEDDNNLPVALQGNNILYLNTDTNKINDIEFSDFLIQTISKYIKDFDVEMSQLTSGKRFIYTDCTIMSKRIPTILLLSYLEGLTTTIKKADINVEFTDKRKTLSSQEKNDKDVIQFADGYLYYDRYPFKNSLLMNAMSLLPTKDYNYADFDNKETYLDIFDTLYSNKMILNAFENFYDLFIDPITLEVLDDLNLPTGFSELLLYGNSLLEDNQYIKENHMALYRLRSNEIVNAVLYQNIADAYSRYRTTAGNKRPEKMSIPQDSVIKGLLMLNTVEDYSKLNPILEAEKLRAVSFKGLSGMNVDRAFTLEKRSYHESMKGIIAMSSPPSGSVGLVRQLAMDVNVLSPRGYLKIADSETELNSANMMCPAELMTPFCAQMDDAPRVAMVTTQTKHVVPCKGYNPLLITNGADRALANVITNDFVFKAKQDGKVMSIDDNLGLIHIKYKDGSIDVIETYEKIYKNGGKHNCHVNPLIAGKSR